MDQSPLLHKLSHVLMLSLLGHPVGEQITDAPPLAPPFGNAFESIFLSRRILKYFYFKDVRIIDLMSF